MNEEYEKYITNYEKVRILGQRADQISKGAPPAIDITGLHDAMSIAEKELAEGKNPLIITRTYPNGKTRNFIVADMKYD